MLIVEHHKTFLTHWGRVTHICVSKLTIIGSDNGLSTGRRQAIIWKNAGILSIGFLGTNFSEILIEILTFAFKKMRLKVSSAKWRPFCLGLNVLSPVMDMLCPHCAGIILWRRPANERWCYIVMSSCIGWGHAQKWSLHCAWNQHIVHEMMPIMDDMLHLVIDLLGLCQITCFKIRHSQLSLSWRVITKN